MTTRKEFEAKPGWRATIRRRESLVFILEGRGSYRGKFYEYPDDWFPRSQPLETEIDEASLARLDGCLADGFITLLAGTLSQPMQSRSMQTASPKSTDGQGRVHAKCSMDQLEVHDVKTRVAGSAGA